MINLDRKHKFHKARKLEERRDWWYRLVTGPIRMLPDFIIVGAQKGGTTSLYSYLVERAPVLPGLVKEVHYFDRNFEKGVYWYRAHFPLTLYRRYLAARHKRDFVTGEASPYYLFHPQVPGRVAVLVPRVKLIAVLRNPVDRAVSHYYHEVRHHRETLAFDEAIAAERRRLEGEAQKIVDDDRYTSFAFQHYSYLFRGIYVDQLRRWCELFSREQILILKSEELFDRPADTLARVLEFLKLPGRLAGEFRRSNPGGYDPIGEAARRRLAHYFEPYNQQLYEFLGVDFGWGA
jgi:hypothetical protein